MKVFVAGATGAIGRPLVSALVAARHAVVGMTSSERGLRVLQKYGADGVVVNAFDSGAVNAAIGRVRPDAVIEELTSLPREYTPEAMRAAASGTTGCGSKAGFSTPTGTRNEIPSAHLFDA